LMRRWYNEFEIYAGRSLKWAGRARNKGGAILALQMSWSLAGLAVAGTEASRWSNILPKSLAVIRDWEWLLIIALLAVEVVILMKIGEEKRERTALVTDLRTTRVELGREKYIEMVKRELRAAQKEVLFLSHSLTTSMSSADKEDLFAAYAHKKGEVHRCITGPDPRRIPAMWEQRRHKVEVRVNAFVLYSTFRFQVCDAKVTVLGLSKEGDELSRTGVLITNVYCAAMMREYFAKLWEASQSFEDYLKDELRRIKSQPGVSIENLSEGWGLESTERLELEAIWSEVGAN
jgi:hypothetical protein